MAELTQRDRRFFTEPNFAHLATVSRGGWPQSTVVWVDVDEECVLINTARHRLKASNVEAVPRVALSITDGGDPYVVLSLQGTVVELREEGAEEHILKLARKYRDEGFALRPGEQRLIMRIRPERIHRYNYQPG